MYYKEDYKVMLDTQVEEGVYPLRRFTRVRQRGELNRASQLQPSGQQISSTIISRPESILSGQD